MSKNECMVSFVRGQHPTIGDPFPIVLVVTPDGGAGGKGAFGLRPHLWRKAGVLGSGFPAR